MIIYLTTIGIIVAAGLAAQARGALPGFQRSLQSSRVWLALQRLVFMPSLVGGSKSRLHEPLPANIGYVPSRVLSLFLGVYIVLNVVLSCVSFSTFSPNLYWASPQFNLCEFVGNRTGTLSLVNLSMAILFAGRNNLLLALTGWSQSTFLVLHRWAARVATVQAVVHSIVYTLAYFEPGYGGASAYAAEVAMPFYVSCNVLLCCGTVLFFFVFNFFFSFFFLFFPLSYRFLFLISFLSFSSPSYTAFVHHLLTSQWWGIIATIAFSLAAGIAVLPARTRLYEVFLVVHIVLAILALIGCWYHLVPHFGFAYGYQTWLFISFAFWAFDRVARVARVLYYSRISAFNAPQQQAIVAAVPGSDSLVHVTVYPRTWRYGPGQHTFLYFPSLGWGKGWESHPFSVARWSDGTEDMEQQQEQQQETGSVLTPAALDKEKSVSGVSGMGTASTSGSDGGAVDEACHAHDAAAAAAAAAAASADSAHDEKNAPVVHQHAQHAQHAHHHHHHHNQPSGPRQSIEFLVRAHSGMTAWLRDYAALGRGRAIDLPLWTEGPYAGHRATLQPLLVADTVLCLVGGIGITHILGLVQEYVLACRATRGDTESAAVPAGAAQKSHTMTRATRFILAWSAHEQALLDYVQQRFLVSASEVPGLEYQFWLTGSDDAKTTAKTEQDAETVWVPATPGRMDVGAVVRSSLEAGRITTVVVCGPNRMADEANRAVVQGVKDGFHVDSIEETFKW